MFLFHVMYGVSSTSTFLVAKISESIQDFLGLTNVQQHDSFFRSFTLDLTSLVTLVGPAFHQLENLLSNDKEWNTSPPPPSMNVVGKLIGGYTILTSSQIEFKNLLRPTNVADI